MTLVFCTNNHHKIEEVTRMMPSNFNFLMLKEIGFLDEIAEPYDTLEENSLTKAQTIYNLFGYHTFSEDTGLFIDSLDGAPGVKSARYAGEKATSIDNVHKVLNELKNNSNRNAFFKTVVTLILDGKVYQFEGKCHGSITTSMEGEKGFGYDPIFVPDGYHETFAQMAPALKNEISHRKKAFDLFFQFLKNNF